MASLFGMKIETLKGVGEKRAALFRKIGAPTVGDLLRLYPRTYEDWSDYLTYEQFLAYNVQYLKVSVGKGLTTEEGLIALIDRFLR